MVRSSQEAGLLDVEGQHILKVALEKSGEGNCDFKM